MLGSCCCGGASKIDSSETDCWARNLLSIVKHLAMKLRDATGKAMDFHEQIVARGAFASFILLAHKSRHPTANGRAMVTFLMNIKQWISAFTRLNCSP